MFFQWNQHFEWRTFLSVPQHLNNFSTELEVFKHRSSHPEVFLEKGVLKICSKFTGEHPCRSAISIKLQSKATLLKSHLSLAVSCKFAVYFQNTFGWLLLDYTSNTPCIIVMVKFIFLSILKRNLKKEEKETKTCSF